MELRSESCVEGKICSQVKNIFFSLQRLPGIELENFYLHRQDKGLTSERILF